MANMEHDQITTCHETRKEKPWSTKGALMIAIDLEKIFNQIFVTFSSWAMIYVPFLVSKRFTQIRIKKRKYTQIHIMTFGDKVKKYLLCIILVAIFSMVAWMLEGHEQKERYEYGLRIFLTLLLPSLFGVYKACKIEEGF